VRADGRTPSGVPTVTFSMKSTALLLLTGLEYPAPSCSAFAGWYSSGNVAGGCGSSGSFKLLLLLLVCTAAAPVPPPRLRARARWVGVVGPLMSHCRCCQGPCCCRCCCCWLPPVLLG
jgi:hypothetical protein